MRQSQNLDDSSYKPRAKHEPLGLEFSPGFDLDHFYLVPLDRLESSTIPPNVRKGFVRDIKNSIGGVIEEKWGEVIAQFTKTKDVSFSSAKIETKPYTYKMNIVEVRDIKHHKTTFLSAKGPTIQIRLLYLNITPPSFKVTLRRILHPALTLKLGVASVIVSLVFTIVSAILGLGSKLAVLVGSFAVIAVLLFFSASLPMKLFFFLREREAMKNFIEQCRGAVGNAVEMDGFACVEEPPPGYYIAPPEK